MEKLLLAVPPGAQITSLEISLIFLGVSLSVIAYYMIKMQQMKRAGEEGFICKKCGEIFLHRTTPPEKCGRNHKQGYIQPVYICTIPRKMAKDPEEN